MKTFEMTVKVELYDETDTAYIYFQPDKKIKILKTIDDYVFADIDEDGEIAGIEVLSNAKALFRSLYHE